MIEILTKLFSTLIARPIRNIFDLLSSSRQKKVDHEISVFGKSNDIMEESALLYILDLLQTEDAYFLNDFRLITRFCHFFREEGNQYINRELRSGCLGLVNSLLELDKFVTLNFFVYPKAQQDTNYRLCLYPNLNLDREGTGDPSEMARYRKFQNELDFKVKTVRIAYRDYRAEIKKKLYV